jgi:RNA 2',3'-cyclic 3'-phosphodiesterase
MRIFLAINPPAEVRHDLWDATAPLRDGSPDIVWVAEPNIHLTLKFIGEMPEKALDSLVSSMTEVARTHAAPEMRLATAGAFPNFRRPRVIWIGIDPEPRLELLHHDVELACDRLGYELDGRPYRPHLTLGRVRAPLDASALKALGTAAKRITFTHDFHARTIDVMQSIPGPGGSKYTVLASAPMRGR